MALYLGSSEKLKLMVNGAPSKLIIHSFPPTINANCLKSSDNYILTDLNCVYLIAKEDK